MYFAFEVGNHQKLVAPNPIRLEVLCVRFLLRHVLEHKKIDYYTQLKHFVNITAFGACRKIFTAVQM